MLQNASFDEKVAATVVVLVIGVGVGVWWGEEASSSRRRDGGVKELLLWQKLALAFTEREGATEGKRTAATAAAVQ